MILPVLNATVGTIAGTLLGIVLLSGNAGGLDALIGLGAPAFSGAITGSSLGLFAGITGGLIGGMVGVVFVALPFGWIFTHAAIGAFTAKIIVAIALTSLVSLFIPH